MRRTTRYITLLTVLMSLTCNAQDHITRGINLVKNIACLEQVGRMDLRDTIVDSIPIYEQLDGDPKCIYHSMDQFANEHDDLLRELMNVIVRTKGFRLVVSKFEDVEVPDGLIPLTERLSFEELMAWAMRWKDSDVDHYMDRLQELGDSEEIQDWADRMIRNVERYIENNDMDHIERQFENEPWEDCE